METLNIPEILNYFDPKMVRSASTTIDCDPIQERKTCLDFNCDENDGKNFKIGRWDYDEQILYL